MTGIADPDRHHFHVGKDWPPNPRPRWAFRADIEYSLRRYAGSPISEIRITSLQAALKLRTSSAHCETLALQCLSFSSCVLDLACGRKFPWEFRIPHENAVHPSRSARPVFAVFVSFANWHLCR